MKTKEEIEAKIKEYQNQKQQISDVSKVEGMQEHLVALIESIKSLDKSIDLLKWVLSD